MEEFAVSIAVNGVESKYFKINQLPLTRSSELPMAMLVTGPNILITEIPPTIEGANVVVVAISGAIMKKIKILTW